MPSCLCLPNCFGRRGRRSETGVVNQDLINPLLEETASNNYKATSELKNQESGTSATNTTMMSDLSVSTSTNNPIDLDLVLDENSDLLIIREPDLLQEQIDLDYLHNNHNELSNVPDDKLDDVQKLEKRYPLSTYAERQRFINAKGGEFSLANEQMKNYLEWRGKYNLDSLTLPNMPMSPALSCDDSFHSCASSDASIDQIDWKYASDKALTHCADENNNKNTRTPAMLPQLVRMLTLPGSDEHLCDREGNRILHLMPAQMNPAVASAETFTLCIAFYLERKLSRDSMEKLAIAIDVRGGRGWANPTPNKLVPFIKKVTACIDKNFPERLSKAVLFPMPRTAAMIWGVIKRFLDPNTASKFAVIPGAAANESPPPYKKMEIHVERDVIELMEEIRVATFQ